MNAKMPTLNPRPRMPKPPTEITVRGLFTWTNVIKWRGRIRGTGVRYVVEARRADEADWMVVGLVDGNKFNHMDQTPGIPIAYRVRSQRGEELSAPSAEATVYEIAASTEGSAHLLRRAVSGLRRHNAHRVLPVTAVI